MTLLSSNSDCAAIQKAHEYLDIALQHPLAVELLNQPLTKQFLTYYENASPFERYVSLYFTLKFSISNISKIPRSSFCLVCPLKIYTLETLSLTLKVLP